jgi:hypothetical protein
MSRTWTISQWFRCIATSATPAERKAAMLQLGWMLSHDQQFRTPPPISLPGRIVSQSGNEAATEERPKTGSGLTPPPSRGGKPTATYASALINAPYEPGDEQGTWPRDRLEQMDARFVRRVERAIASGQEHQPVPPR